MIFNSWEFFIFSLLFFSVFYFLNQKNKNRFLLISSYFFYGAWDYRFLLLIFISTIIDYSISLKIHKSNDHGKRKKLVILSCIVNLSILGFFKYCDFFILNINEVSTFFGIDSTNLALLKIILPVGISFYTFQTMSYTIDVYRKQIKPITNFLDYALYVSYFPQLVAGPIERASNLIPQVVNKRVITKNMISSGLWLITWGFFKKVAIADNLAMLTDKVFINETPESGLIALIGIYAFTFQIYCDFSGYTDIARGLSKLMGINLMMNFKLPYLSTSPQDFWRRWHISLSSWLKDYLYIPLGGNKGSILRNLMITMVLGGLWHGAAWNFILWGFYQGTLLIIHRQVFKNMSFHIPHWLKVISMFQLTCLGWLIFRAESLTQIYQFLSVIMTDFFHTSLPHQMIFSLVFFVSLLNIFEFFFKNTEDPRSIPLWSNGGKYIIPVIIWLLTITLMPPQGKAFIYFQF